MNTDHEDYVARVAADREPIRAALIERAADRPAHAAFLADLLAADDPDEVTPPKGVSGRVEDALWTDVHWLRYNLSTLAPGSWVSGYPNAYDDLRVRDARAALERTRARERAAATLPESIARGLRWAAR